MWKNGNGYIHLDRKLSVMKSLEDIANSFRVTVERDSAGVSHDDSLLTARVSCSDVSTMRQVSDFIVI